MNLNPLRIGTKLEATVIYSEYEDYYDGSVVYATVTRILDVANNEREFTLTDSYLVQVRAIYHEVVLHDMEMVYGLGNVLDEAEVIRRAISLFDELRKELENHADEHDLSDELVMKR